MIRTSHGRRLPRRPADCEWFPRHAPVITTRRGGLRKLFRTEYLVCCWECDLEVSVGASLDAAREVVWSLEHGDRKTLEEMHRA